VTSLRSHRRIGVPADRAWAVLREPTGVADWFPSIAECTVDGDIRTCWLSRGGSVRERVVTVDDELRRFQYSILEGLPVTTHLATVDVLEVAPGECLVVYSTEATPDSTAGGLGRAVESGVDALKSYLER
jgi:uncharacterized protein YndB with AHSA1/START domain